VAIQNLEARVMTKVTRRIVPYVMILYFIAFLDRVNIGFAALQMNADLGLSPVEFGLGAGLFFLGYLVFEVPSNIILHKVGARFWIGRVMVTWGLVSGAMAFTTGVKSFYSLRVLLGLAEAGFFPGIILYLSYWFPAHRRAAVTAMFMAAAPVAGVIGGPLSAALLQLDGTFGIRGWQWLFLVEAMPAVIFGVATLFYLTDRPEQARWLADDERTWLIRTMADERARLQHRANHSPWQALANPRVFVLALAYFGTSAGLYTVGIWSPQIIKEFGFSVVEVGYLSAVPSLIAIVGMVVWSRHSDSSGERYWHAALACLVAAIGMGLAANAAGSIVVALVGLSFTAWGVSAAKPPLWSIPTTFLSGSAAAAGIGLINSLGTLGGAAGPYMIGSAKGSSGSFGRGLYFVGGTLVMSAIVILLLRAVTTVPARTEQELRA
jgi:ACS family tartrate transporter-like MFS transporter